MRDRADIDDDAATFHPTFAHQVFGENETIFGYRDLRVRIFYTAGSLNIYMGLRYAERIDDFAGGDGNGDKPLRPDDVMAKCADLITSGCFYTSIEEFAAKVELERQRFRPFGEKVDELRLEDERGEEHVFEFYKCDVQTPGFVAFHARMQTFMMWFVDAASYIDTDDVNWQFYVW